jgi:hypothetical protein
MKYFIRFFIILLIQIVFYAFGNIYCFGQKNIHLNLDSIYNYENNSGFQDFSECPFEPNQLDNAKNWSRQVSFVNTPDYFHQCTNILYNNPNLIVGVPENFAGYQQPLTGDAYVGISISTFTERPLREFFHTKLKKNLEKGVEYKVGMYVSLADYAKFANDRFRFCLTTENRFEKKWRYSKGLSFDIPICKSGVLFKSDTLITDTVNWVNIEVEYTASGGEQYLTIGVFAGDIKWWERILKRRVFVNKDWDKQIHKTPSAYYYIDNVYLIRKEDYLNTMQNDDDE